MHSNIPEQAARAGGHAMSPLTRLSRHALHISKRDPPPSRLTFVECFSHSGESISFPLTRRASSFEDANRNRLAHRREALELHGRAGF